MKIMDKWLLSSGSVYIIKNKINKKVYIGVTISWVPRRWDSHKNSLKKNKHQNKNLQEDWNIYGQDNFTFEVLEIVSTEDLYRLENMWIKSYGSDCYNIVGAKK